MGLLFSQGIFQGLECANWRTGSRDSILFCSQVSERNQANRKLDVWIFQFWKLHETGCGHT